MRGVFFEVMRERWSPMVDAVRPRTLCCRSGDCEASCERSGSGVFHFVRGSVMLQQHHGKRFLHGDGLLGAVVSASMTYDHV